MRSAMIREPTEAGCSQPPSGISRPRRGVLLTRWCRHYGFRRSGIPMSGPGAAGPLATTGRRGRFSTPVPSRVLEGRHRTSRTASGSTGRSRRGDRLRRSASTARITSVNAADAHAVRGVGPLPASSSVMRVAPLFGAGVGRVSGMARAAGWRHPRPADLGRGTPALTIEQPRCRLPAAISVEQRRSRRSPAEGAGHRQRRTP